MTTNFPGTGIDSFPTHSTGDVIQASFDNNEQDALVALETKVGVNGSAVSTTHDYKLSGVLGTDKAASLAGSEALTNKSVNGVTLSTSAGSTNFLQGDGNYGALTVPDASYSTKGKVEFLTDAATSGITVSSGVANVNYGVGNNQIVKLNGSAQLPAVDGSLLTNVSPTGTGLNNLIHTNPLSNSTFTYIAQLVPTSGTTINGWITSSGAYSQSTVGVTLLGVNISNMSMHTAIDDGVGASYVPNDGKTISIKFRVKANSGAGVIGFGMALQTTPATFYAAETDVVAGFRFVNDGGTLFAQNANGTTKTSTNISGSLTLTNFNTYEVVFTPGVSAAFYVNGALVATQTTNLPTTQSLDLGFGCSTNSNVIFAYSPIITIQT